MNTRVLRTLLGAPLAIVLLVLSNGCSDKAETAPAQAGTVLERGKYLADRVGNCADCHTPHLPNGAPDQTRWLQGAPLGFTPVQPVPGWVSAAPPIAGMPAGWSEEQFVSFLETGQKPGGAMAAPPMPPYRFTHEDALAVAAYLKSLPPAATSLPAK